jgi:hypothetical protein
MLAAHCAVPWLLGAGQAMPHAPQLSASVTLLVQLIPHKSGEGAAHCDLHWKPLAPPSAEFCAHSGAAVVHIVVHEPQLAGLEMSTSHPSSGLLEQCA